MGRSSTVAWTTNDGRNDWDDPIDVPDTMSVESVNISLRRGGLGNKRGGSVRVTITGDPITGGPVHLAKFLPGEDLSAMELFIVSASGQILRVPAPSNVADDLTLLDAISATPWLVTTAMLNGKLFITYNSTVNRLHVYDPATSTTTVRRVGLPIPGSPTVANTGAGAYPATPRFYRVAWRVKSGTRILRQSELGGEQGFLPSGTGLAARVFAPAAPAASEGVTHWVVYGSPDDLVYYELAEIVIATASYDDTELPSAYSLHPAAPIDGSNFPFPSVRYLASDGVRLFGLGAWETTPGDSVVVQPGTAYWTPPLGSSEIGSTVGVGDDERTQSTVLQDDALPLSVVSGGADRGISGPFYNSMYFFQTKGIYKLVPTGDAEAPFRRVTVSRHFGSVSHPSQVMGEDEAGNECIYFLDPHDGPRRIVVGDGIEWLGKDINAFWRTVNVNAPEMAAHGVYDRVTKQVKWWVAVTNGPFGGAEPVPITTMIVYHVTLGFSVRGDDAVRGGWAIWTADPGDPGPTGHLTLPRAFSSLIFPTTIDGPRPTTECVYKCQLEGISRQDGTSLTDVGTPYQAFILSKAWVWGVLVQRKRILDAFVTTGRALAGTRLEQTILKDFGTEAITQEIAIETPVATQATMVRAHVQGCDIADAICDQVQLGDGYAVANTWAINRWDAIVEGEDTR